MTRPLLTVDGVAKHLQDTLDAIDHIAMGNWDGPTMQDRLHALNDVADQVLNAIEIQKTERQIRTSETAIKESMQVIDEAKAKLEELKKQ